MDSKRYSKREPRRFFYFISFASLLGDIKRNASTLRLERHLPSFPTILVPLQPVSPSSSPRVPVPVPGGGFHCGGAHRLMYLQEPILIVIPPPMIYGYCALIVRYLRRLPRLVKCCFAGTGSVPGWMTYRW